MDDELRQLFQADQKQVAQSEPVDWALLMKMLLPMLREARAAGATPQEAQIIIAGVWQGISNVDAAEDGDTQ